MAPLPSGLPEAVGDGEELARFLTQRGHYSQARADAYGCVHPDAFLPNSKDRAMLVSRHGREPLADLQAIGRLAAGDGSLYGAAILNGMRHDYDASVANPSTRPHPNDVGRRRILRLLKNRRRYRSVRPIVLPGPEGTSCAAPAARAPSTAPKA